MWCEKDAGGMTRQWGNDMNQRCSQGDVVGETRWSNDKSVGVIAINKGVHKAMWYEKHAGGMTSQWGNNKK